MKKLMVFLLFLAILGSTLVCIGQESDTYLRIKAKVIKIPESSFDQDDEPAENRFVILTYKVLKVCEGEYNGDEVKVAQGISRKKIKEGDTVAIDIKPTKEFRETAEILQELGITRSEESIADYVFVQFNKSNPCL